MSLKLGPFSKGRDAFQISWKQITSNFHDFNNSSMTNTVIVPRVTSHVSEISRIASRNKRSFERSTRDLPSIYSAEFSKTSGLDHLRKNLQTEGVSKRSSDFITNSWCTGSLKHYKLARGKWVSLCNRREVCPTRCDTSYVLDFLAELFDEGHQYNTIGLD